MSGAGSVELAPTDSEECADSPKTRIFISYSRKDTQFVDRLAHALVANGYDAFVDREDISGGEAWKERLDQLILQADAVAFVISPDSVTSPVCDWETNRTLELGKRLVPVLWRPIAPGAAPVQLARLNYILADTPVKFEPAVAQLGAACDVDIVWVREHTRLVNLAARWEATGRDADALLRGSELAEAEVWGAQRTPLAPNIPEALIRYLQESRSAQVAALAKERRNLRRVQRLQTGVGGLIALAAVIVLIAGLGVTRLMSGLGQRTSLTMAELARVASDESSYDRAARYALAGSAGSDWPLIGYHADDSTAELRRALTGPLIAILPGQGGPMRGASFSPDGRRIVTISWDGASSLWNAANGQQLAAVNGVYTEPYEGAGVSFSPDGTRYVIAMSDATARIVEASSGREVGVLRGHREPISGAAWSGDGRRIVTFSSDRTARVWESSSGREVATLRGHEDAITDARFGSDGRRVVSASLDHTARLWNADSGRQVGALSGVYAERYRTGASVALSPDGARVVIALNDATARLLDVSSGREVVVLRGHREPVDHARFSVDGARILTSSRQDGTSRLWDALDGRELLAVSGSEADLSPDGTRITTVQGSGTVVLWDARDGQEVSVFRHPDVLSVTGEARAGFSPDGTRVLTTSPSDPNARVWDAVDGDELGVLSGHADSLHGVAFSADGGRIVTACHDGSARVWRAPGHGGILDGLGWDAGIEGIAYVNNGTRIVAVDSSGRTRSWNASGGEVAGPRQLTPLSGDLVGGHPLAQTVGASLYGGKVEPRATMLSAFGT